MKTVGKVMQKLEGEGCGTIIGVLLLIGIIFFGAYCLSGLVIWLLWNNVITAIFTEVPSFGYWLCVGISLVLSVITNFVRGLYPSHNDE